MLPKLLTFERSENQTSSGSRKMRVSKFLPILAIAGVAIGGSAFAQEIKIGFHAPLTGFAAADGKSAVTGAQLAIDQINAKGGVKGKKLKLVIYDDQASPKNSVPIANKLIGQDKVTIAISGSYSGATRAAASVFQKAKVPYIAAYAVHPSITKAGDYVFRTSFVGEVQGRAGAKLVGEILKKKRVVLITLKNDFGRSLVRGFKEKAKAYGITIVSEYEYSIKNRQFGPMIAKVKADKPDAIYATGYFFTAGPLVRQLRAAGVKAQVIGQEGYDSQKFIKIAGPAAEGVIITTSLNRDSKRAATRSFIDAFEKKAGYKADMVAATAHTAVHVAAKAMAAAGKMDPKSIRDAISKTTVDASTGRISFNSLGEVQKAVLAQIVRGGNWHFHSKIDDKKLLAPPTK
jgi:branched-chain amino acid transport system substrate-binding protein